MLDQMQVFSILMALGSGAVGIYLAYHGIKKSGTATPGESSVKELLSNSGISALAVAALFFCMLSIVGIFNKTIWSASNLSGALLVSAAVGLFIAVGSLLHTLSGLGLRRIVLRLLEKKQKSS
jgi:hypothetical protein